MCAGGRAPVVMRRWAIERPRPLYEFDGLPRVVAVEAAEKQAQAGGLSKITR